MTAATFRRTGSACSRCFSTCFRMPSNTIARAAQSRWLAGKSREHYASAVTDTGPGIPPEGLAKLFMPFERLGAAESGIEGTGLGLAFSKIFVEAMGGSIGVESTVGEGTTFWFDLPWRPRPQMEVELRTGFTITVRLAWRSAAPARCSTSKTIFPTWSWSSACCIDYPSIQVISATRGEQGCKLARQFRPDLILLDLHLPDIRGDEVLRRLRADEATREIPVVMLSADATGDQAHAAVGRGRPRLSHQADRIARTPENDVRLFESRGFQSVLEPNLKNARILIVDDQEANVRLLAANPGARQVRQSEERHGLQKRARRSTKSSSPTWSCSIFTCHISTGSR